MGLTRVILTAGAALAGAVALAGCGGGGSASGTTVGTTRAGAGGVAGVQTTRHGASASFDVQARGLERRIRSATTRLANGDLAGAAAVGGPLLTSCQGTVSKRLSPRASTAAQQEAVSHLRTACQDLANASRQGASGDMSAAKQLARQALDEAQQAVRQLH